MLSTFDHEPSRVVQMVLIALGLGSLPTDGLPWPVWSENEADRPDCAVTVQETQGRDDLRDMVDGNLDGTFGFQIRVRGNNRPAAKYKASQIVGTIADRGLCYFDKEACWVSFDPVTGTGLSRYVLQTFVRIGYPIPMGADVPGGKRQVYTVNCEARIIQQA